MDTGTALALGGVGAIGLYLFLRRQQQQAAPVPPPPPPFDPCGPAVVAGGAILGGPQGAAIASNPTVNSGACAVAKQIYSGGQRVGSAIPDFINTSVLGGAKDLPMSGGALLARAMCDCYNASKVFAGNPLIIQLPSGQVSGCAAVDKLAPGIRCDKGACDCHPTYIDDPASAVGGSVPLAGTIKYRTPDGKQTLTERYDLAPANISGLRGQLPGGGTTINFGNVF